MDLQKYDDLFKLGSTHWWTQGRIKIFDCIISKYSKKGADILDIGCGVGTNYEMLGRHGNVSCLEYSRYAIDYCRQCGMNNVVEGGINSIPYGDNSFDVVTAFDVIEHVEDDKAAVSEMIRVCKNGGIIVITVPAYMFLWSYNDVFNHHKRRYDREQIVNLVKGSINMHIEKVTYFNMLLFVPIVVLRRIKSLIKKDKLLPDLKPTNPVINKLLFWIFSFERHLIRRLGLPFGVSLLIVARKE